ncbi:MAG TPA: ThiF family adenylyltransferase [Streptosporangiaceae bacterium]|nr:ThiF family adenylyltransferase [Streptosporangiaceae bacterium]
MRLALKPGLARVWRDSDTLQIGIDPRRAVAISGAGHAAALIGLLDGSRDRAGMIAAAGEHGISAEAADELIKLLAAAGVLDEFPAGALRAVPDGVRSRLAPELATTSLAHGDGDGGARSLARRDAAYVRVYGAGKVGATLAALLASSGIGHVTCRDTATAFAADLTPGGLCEADIGAPRQSGAARAIKSAAPQVRTEDDAGRPDLAVLTGQHGPELAATLMSGGVPHLSAAAGEAIGVAGPLVLPGRTACLRCLNMTRADADPQWPLVLAQLTGCQPATPACDCVLATSVAAQACAQVLTFIDRRGKADAVINGTLELVLPGWQWRRRTWLPHPACGCGAATYPTGRQARVRASGSGDGQC